MRKFLSVIVIMVSVHANASERIENILTDYMDSIFVANEVDTEKAKDELLTYFKTKYKIKAEFEGLMRSMRKKHKNFESDNFKPIDKGYSELKKIARTSENFFQPLTQRLYYALLEDATYLSKNDDTELFHFLWNFQMWGTSTYTAYGFLIEVDDIERYTENNHLIESFYLVMLADKLVNHPEYVSKQSFVKNQLNDISLDSANGINPNTADTNFTIYRPYSDIEREPVFVGGESMMMDYINNAVIYPEEAQEMGVYGIVYVRFVVDRDGRIESVTVVRSPDDILSKEAIRVILNMPRWVPGEQKGRSVRVRFTLPVNFRLG